MTSEEQYKKQIEETLKLVKELLENQKKGKTCTISELAKSTGITFSTIQRRLDNKVMIDNLLGRGTFEQVKQILKENKKSGQILGGRTYASNNRVIKEENGLFKGPKEKIKYGGRIMENKSKYNFIGKIALEYRLSLNSLCRVLGKEPNEELKMEIYNAILATISSYNSLCDAYKFLFNYETLNESKEVVRYTISNYRSFANRYNEAKRNNNRDELVNITNELKEIDLKFQKLMNRKTNYKLTTEDYLVVSKYRLKYALSRYKVSELLNISRDTLTDKEKKIEDPILREKLNLLDEFYKDIGLTGKKYK